MITNDTEKLKQIIGLIREMKDEADNAKSIIEQFRQFSKSTKKEFLLIAQMLENRRNFVESSRRLLKDVEKIEDVFETENSAEIVQVLATITEIKEYLEKMIEDVENLPGFDMFNDSVELFQ